MQRSHIRVESAEAELTLANPGKYVPGRSLVEGMEVVVADEIGYSPDTIVTALTEAGLVYREHLHRGVSVVVCNKTTDLRGKAMHAVRKGIPLLGDTAFLDALTRVKPHPDPDAPVEQSTHPRAVPSQPAGKASGKQQSGKPSGKQQSKQAEKQNEKPAGKQPRKKSRSHRRRRSSSRKGTPNPASGANHTSH